MSNSLSGSVILFVISEGLILLFPLKLLVGYQIWRCQQSVKPDSLGGSEHVHPATHCELTWQAGSDLH